jgi:2-hydroxychromene-2-carboxylate isomerase
MICTFKVIPPGTDGRIPRSEGAPGVGNPGDRRALSGENASGGSDARKEPGMASRTVRFYFDFISPYSWLALRESDGFAREHDIRWDLRPVVYAVLLDRTGLIGPAETPAKRRYSFYDVARCAASLGARFTGPPEHPFRSLEALRTVCLFRTDPRAPALALRMADACWEEGRPLTDMAVLEDVVAAVGLEARDLAARIADPAIKGELARLTEEALALGAFGVPTFVLDDELFWGHDRMEQLAGRLSGRIASVAAKAEAMLARPRGADRRGSPARRDGGSKSG